MRNVNIPSPSVLNDKLNMARAIQELYSFIKELSEDSSEQVYDLQSEIYTLKQQVGKLGGEIVYDLPNELGKSFNALMSNNGTVKLT